MLILGSAIKYSCVRVMISFQKKVQQTNSMSFYSEFFNSLPSHRTFKTKVCTHFCTIPKLAKNVLSFFCVAWTLIYDAYIFQFTTCMNFEKFPYNMKKVNMTWQYFKHFGSSYIINCEKSFLIYHATFLTLSCLNIVAHIYRLTSIKVSALGSWDLFSYTRTQLNSLWHWYMTRQEFSDSKSWLW